MAEVSSSVTEGGDVLLQIEILPDFTAQDIVAAFYRGLEELSGAGELNAVTLAMCTAFLITLFASSARTQEVLQVERKENRVLISLVIAAVLIPALNGCVPITPGMERDYDERHAQKDDASDPALFEKPRVTRSTRPIPLLEPPEFLFEPPPLPDEEDGKGPEPEDEEPVDLEPEFIDLGTEKDGILEWYFKILDESELQDDAERFAAKMAEVGIIKGKNLEPFEQRMNFEDYLESLRRARIRQEDFDLLMEVLQKTDGLGPFKRIRATYLIYAIERYCAPKSTRAF